METLTRITSNIAIDVSVVGGVLFLFALGFAIRRIRKLRRQEHNHSTE